MRRLKMALCTVLSLVILLSSMLIGAGATYKDQAGIQHTEAVNKLTELIIINGKGDGYFDPTGYITRAEFCKMICIALNGGHNPQLRPKESPSYRDIKGHWAEAYIEYHSALAIVSGCGNGLFEPNATITGEQAAKMMLGVAGYDPSFFKFTGANWAHYVNTRATEAGLYKDLQIDYSAPLSRDAAAQLLYNGIIAPSVQYTTSEDPITGAPIRGYSLTGQTLYSRYKLPGASPDASTATVEVKPVEYGPVFSGLLWKSIDDAHTKFGQPLETILYEKTGKFNFAPYGDVYPGFTIIYGGLDKTICMINITSAQISVWGCHYGMSGAEIKSALGTAGLVPSMAYLDIKDFSYHVENKTNPIRITFFDDALTSIKNIHLAATK